MCFICTERHLHIAGYDRLGEASHYKGSIVYHTIRKVMGAIEGNDRKWDENFDYQIWRNRYAPQRRSSCDEDEHGYNPESWEWRRIINFVPYGGETQSEDALCCPEDF